MRKAPVLKNKSLAFAWGIEFKPGPTVSLWQGGCGFDSNKRGESK